MNGVNGFHKHSTQSTGKKSPVPNRLVASSEPPSISAFQSLCSQQCPQYSLASSIQSNVPVYDLHPFSSLGSDQKSALQNEWHHILLSGPGVFVTKGLFKDQSLLDRVNDTFSSIIKQEKVTSTSRGDHFAGSGKNDRIWNSFSKHCLADPSSFLTYYSNPYLSLISDAWLGPHYHITAQVNIVKPGGAAQISHRDYHLGFQTAEACARYPKAMQVASQFLTLQGAVAQTDVPADSGPTRLLPFSQMFEDGYVAYRLPEFKRFFEENWVALPLEKGDGIFFNPALFHAAGENVTSDFHRSANLLQISSAFGKPMEMIDTLPLVEKSWDGLMKIVEEQGIGNEVESFVKAVAEGYPFPTNLDRRVPRMGGAAPESEQEILIRCIQEKKGTAEVMEQLWKMKNDSMA